MKKIIFVFALMLAVLNANAQNGFNYREWAFGFEGGVTRPYADLTKKTFGYCASASVYYNYSPYLPVGLELQIGRLSGGGIPRDIDIHTRQFENSYKALTVHADLQMGEVINYADSWLMDRLKGFYIGGGAGFIFNKM
ncbi:MAG: hypothetical protein EOP51_31210, partial [Sphingobacteriales bacterium]